MQKQFLGCASIAFSERFVFHLSHFTLFFLSVFFISRFQLPPAEKKRYHPH
jgi:hypothetical protein